MRAIITIATLKFRELVRERVFYLALAIAFILFGLSLVFGSLTFDEKKRILADFGLAGIEWSLMILAVFIGSYSLPKEFERQTCLIVLSRPVSRIDFLLGLYTGLCGVLTILGAGLFILLLSMLEADIEVFNAVAVFLSLLMKPFICAALAFLLSLIVRPILAAATGLCIYLVGHWLEDARNLAIRSKNESLLQFSETMDLLAPNFYKFNWKTFYFLKEPIINEALWWMLMHSVLWVVLLLVLASLAFRRKQIV